MTTPHWPARNKIVGSPPIIGTSFFVSKRMAPSHLGSMVDGRDARGGTTNGPERLFACDPELARIRPLLDADRPPDGAAERVLAKVESGAAHPLARPRISRPGLALSLVAGAALFAVAASELGRTAAPVIPVSAVSVPSAPSSDPVMLPPARSGSFASSAPSSSIPGVHVETIRVEDLPRAPAPATSSSGDAFELEITLVERARSALARGRGRECLDVAAQYRKRLENKGQFNEEIEVMRIEALAMTGERARARALAALFLEQHGETPYAERLRRVLQSPAGER